MGAEFIEKKALFDIIIKICPRTSTFYVCDYFIGEQGSAGWLRKNFQETTSRHLEATLT